MTEMERYDHVLPDWTRQVWASQEAKDVWAPRRQRVSAAWSEVERAAVPELRPAALIYVGEDEYRDASVDAARRGLALVPVSKQAPRGQSYSSTGNAPAPGEPFEWRYVLARPEDAVEFAAADDAGVGRLLGYPECCRDFFVRTWIDGGYVDTTWPMVAGEAGSRHVEMPPEDAPWGSNILLRWLGVRPVPHLPCSFRCEATVEQAGEFRQLMEDLGYVEEARWAEEMLRWPAQWSALHGGAVIKTPAVKVSARTDATPDKYVVDKGGDRYPEEGAYGTSFPYRSREKFVRLTSTPAFRRAFEDEDLWRHNGFETRDGMEAAHDVVVEAFRSRDVPPGNVLDLGCGNGRLVSHLCGEGHEAFGVEKEEGAVAHARALYPDGSWVHGRIEEPIKWIPHGPFSAAVLMPGRLLEMDEEDAGIVLGGLREYAPRVLVYAYGDVLRDNGGLEALCARAGVGATEDVRGGQQAAAGWIKLQEEGT